MKKPLYQAIHTVLDALNTCIKKDNQEWANHWREVLDTYEKEHLPSGSGFDSGTQISTTESNDRRIVLHTSYHHMNEYGFYTKWTEHDIILTPSFQGFDMRITGRNHNDIKDYIRDVFQDYLTREVDDE